MVRSQTRHARFILQKKLHETLVRDNGARRHSQLNGISPEAFEEVWRKQDCILSAWSLALDRHIQPYRSPNVTNPTSIHTR